MNTDNGRGKKVFILRNEKLEYYNLRSKNNEKLSQYYDLVFQNNEKLFQYYDLVYQNKEEL